MLIFFSKSWQHISGNCNCLHVNIDYSIQCKLCVSQWPVSFRHKRIVSIHILVVCMTAFNHYTVKAAIYVPEVVTHQARIWVFWLRFLFVVS